MAVELENYEAWAFKQKRKLLGLSVAELANHCKLSKVTIYNVENGKCIIPSTILLIGLVLDTLATDEQIEIFRLIEKGDII